MGSTDWRAFCPKAGIVQEWMALRPFSCHLCSGCFFVVSFCCSRSVRAYALARISHKPNGLVRNPYQPQSASWRTAETSTRREGLARRAQRALLRANPERVPRHTMRDESKPFGRISHSSGEKCGLEAPLLTQTTLYILVRAQRPASVARVVFRLLDTRQPQGRIAARSCGRCCLNARGPA